MCGPLQEQIDAPFLMMIHDPGIRLCLEFKWTFGLWRGYLCTTDLHLLLNLRIDISGLPPYWKKGDISGSYMQICSHLFFQSTYISLVSESLFRPQFLCYDKKTFIFMSHLHRHPSIYLIDNHINIASSIGYPMICSIYYSFGEQLIHTSCKRAPNFTPRPLVS